MFQANRTYGSIQSLPKKPSNSSNSRSSSPSTSPKSANEIPEGVLTSFRVIRVNNNPEKLPLQNQTDDSSSPSNFSRVNTLYQGSISDDVQTGQRNIRKTSDSSSDESLYFEPASRSFCDRLYQLSPSSKQQAAIAFTIISTVIGGAIGFTTTHTLEGTAIGLSAGFVVGACMVGLVRYYYC